MLGAPLCRRRSLWPTCTRLESLVLPRLHIGRTFVRPWSKRSSANRLSKRERDALKKERAGAIVADADGRDGRQRSKQQNNNSGTAAERPLAESAGGSHTPSLIEQLFPEENAKYRREAASKEREVPRLPLDRLVRPRQQTQLTRKERLLLPQPSLSRNAREALKKRQAQEALQGKRPSVLVLRKASKNLTMQDFRRLIPQGQHIQGWNLDKGSIVSVIAGRDLATLEHQGRYYLIFASELSAFAYQGHATRVSRLVAQQTPTSLHKSLPPPPEYMLDGMDVDAVLQAYTLTPPTQKIDLRQLKRPFTPVVDAIVRYGGYPALQTRSDKMPYELRLTLEGPQLTMARIRHILRESNRDRALCWAGGESNEVIISQWEPIEHVSDASRNLRNARATEPSQPKTGDFESGIDILTAETTSSWASSSHDEKRNHGQTAAEEKRRTPNPVYILGFHTEHAAQSFMRYWHRRPMDWGGGHKDEEGDIPPLANVEILW